MAYTILKPFSPVIKLGIIQSVLSLALVRQWDIRKLDVKNAFLHGYINEVIYMEQPLGMPDPKFPSHVCKLQKALYGLKHTPRAWFDRFSAFLLKQGFFFSLVIRLYLSCTHRMAHWSYFFMMMICC